MLELTIGPSTSDAGDVFQVIATSPRAFEKRHNRETCMIARHTLFVFEYDWAQIEKHLTARMGGEWPSHCQTPATATRSYRELV